MNKVRTASYPNIVDIIVVMVTCLVVLMLAFPLAAAEQPVAIHSVAIQTVPEVQVFKVEFTVSEQPKKKITLSSVGKAKMNKQVSSPIKQTQVNAEENQVAVDLDTLKLRLKSSKAIGLFTKLEIRNDIVGLVDDIHRYREQDLLEVKLAEVRSSFDSLLLKMVDLLKGDPMLSRDLYTGREHIWESLLEVKA